MNGIAYVVLVILLISFIITVMFLKKKASGFAKAVEVAGDNNFYCQRTGRSCSTEIDKDIQIPTIDPNTLSDYNPIIGKFCADLIRRFDKTIKESLTPYPLPVLTILYTKMDDTPFGIVFKDKDTAYIAFRGTKDANEFKADLDSTQVNFEKSDVFRGFYTLYTEMYLQIAEILRKEQIKNVVICGHSLGASVAVLVGVELKIDKFNVCIYTFGGPRVGDFQFCELIDHLKIGLFRYVNTEDIIPTLPSSVYPNYAIPNAPFIYKHCGVEKSFGENRLSLMQNHHMNNYFDHI